MSILIRLFVALYAWIPLLLWTTEQPDAQALLMWPMIDTVMVGILVALGSSAAFVLLRPRRSPKIAAC